MWTYTKYGYIKKSRQLDKLVVYCSEACAPDGEFLMDKMKVQWMPRPGILDVRAGNEVDEAKTLAWFEQCFPCEKPEGRLSCLTVILVRFHH